MLRISLRTSNVEIPSKTNLIKILFFLLPLKSPLSGPEYIYSPDCMCLQTFISLQLWLLIQARLCGWITKTTGSCHTADGRNECEWMKTAPCCLPPWTLCPREHSWCKTENNLSFHRFTPLLLHLLRAHRYYCFFMSPSCSTEQDQPAYLLMKF